VLSLNDDEGKYIKLICTEYCAGGKIEKNEMDRACGTYGGGERVYRVLVGKPWERDHWGDPDVDGG
jgi:hypothetical protein